MNKRSSAARPGLRGDRPRGRPDRRDRGHRRRAGWRRLGRFGRPGTHGKAQHAKQQERENTPATYEVKSGDTLISIAHRYGVTVARIEALNPEVDPQILIAGEQLKLR